MFKADVVTAEWKRWEKVIETGDIGQLRPERGNEWEEIRAWVPRDQGVRRAAGI